MNDEDFKERLDAWITREQAEDSADDIFEHGMRRAYDNIIAYLMRKQLNYGRKNTAINSTLRYVIRLKELV